MNRVILIAALFSLRVFGQSFTASGEILRPGAYSLPKDATVVRAIAAASGFIRFASPDKTVIVRKEHEISVDLKGILEGRASDVALQDGDVVLVPKARPREKLIARSSAEF